MQIMTDIDNEIYEYRNLGSAYDHLKGYGRGKK